MLSILGSTILFLACIFAGLQSIVPLWGHWQKNLYALPFARCSAFAQFILVCLAYLVLVLAFYTNDFSIAYVANNAHPTLPLLYRLSAVWGAHEGSILLWIVILNVWTMAFYALTYKKYFTDARITLTLALLGLISFCFLIFLLLTSNPFVLATTAQTGRDLNPLLQDPGFITHPPMLYLGYVGFSVAFALTHATLLAKQPLDPFWTLTIRRFTIAAWCFLTLGIVLGSWWAYRVLGWGGFWFWDPVENASLLPWLAGTALIHVLILVEKRQAAQHWAVIIAMLCFGLSLLGTFLVRSGVLVSAHTFASDPDRGVFLLAMLAILFSLSVLVYFKYAGHFSTTQTRRPSFLFFSREMGLLINSSLLIIGMLTILIGTLYPLILDAFSLGQISVGAPYFNLVLLPLVCLLMAIMAWVPFCSWGGQSFALLWQRIWRKIFTSILFACVLLWMLAHAIDFSSAVSLSLCFCIITSVLFSGRVLPSMSLGHAGFAILIIGIILSALLSQEREIRIQPGETADLGPYQFIFSHVSQANGPNYRGIRADFNVLKNKRFITTLQPEKRIYLVREMVMTKVDIHPSIFRDLYIALGEPLADDAWSVRLYYKPFIRFIWFGGLIMIVGGFLSLRKNHAKN